MLSTQFADLASNGNWLGFGWGYSPLNAILASQLRCAGMILGAAAMAAWHDIGGGYDGGFTVTYPRAGRGQRE